jgi:anaerobic magnesium-protoporphyrin IX monomethyl ester cyclase
MKIVLWDTRQLDVSKDFAGGYGVGQYASGGGIRGSVVRWFYKRDRRPPAMTFAYLTSIFRQLGHTVEYTEDDVPADGDIYVFCPSLITLNIELAAIREVFRQQASARVLIVGILATTVPEAFADLSVTLVQGEPEQLLWKLDEVLNHKPGQVSVGSVKSLDELPFPDWDLFEPKKLRIGYDFSQFPTGLIQQSRGCTFTCNYCPYIIIENKTRFRSPESVVEEMRRGMAVYGFRSFKFRDPLFGLDRKRVLRLAELIGELPRKIQFSIESRIDLLRPETLTLLKSVGLTSITVGIETPDEKTLKHYKRAPINDDKQRVFVETCRRLGIRTVAGFMIGFPEDTAQSIKGVLRYAKSVNPTFANFNIVTPYPGTEFYNQAKQDIADFDYTKYNVYTPVMKYQNLTHDEVRDWHARCYQKFFFRWDWLKANAHLVWPSSKWLGFKANSKVESDESKTALVETTAEKSPTVSAIPLPIVDDAAACGQNRAA